MHISNCNDRVCAELCEDLESFSRHIFNADWQFDQYKQLRDDLPPKWLLSVVDFSENYICCYQDEISAAYFQYQQAEIHPTQLFYKCQDPICEEDCNETVSHSILFVSNNLKHDHHAVVCTTKRC